MACEVKRLFFAIELPDDLRRRAVSALPVVKGVKTTKTAQLHLTLLFLGDVPVERMDDIRAAASKIVFNPFDLKVTGSGFFPDARRPSVFWLGLSESPVLMKLQSVLLQGMADLGLEFRESRFVPHITLARIKQRVHRDDISRLQDSARLLEGREFEVSEFILFSSELHPSGAVHTVVASFGV